MNIHWDYDQLVQVADLRPHPKNPNTHSATQVAAIAAVLEGNGWRASITVSNRSGFITHSHGALAPDCSVGTPVLRRGVFRHPGIAVFLTRRVP
jgi:hypothetical protein